MDATRIVLLRDEESRMAATEMNPLVHTGIFLDQRWWRWCPVCRTERVRVHPNGMDSLEYNCEGCHWGAVEYLDYPDFQKGLLRVLSSKAALDAKS